MKTLVESVAAKADESNLVVDRNREAEHIVELTTYITTLSMNFFVVQAQRDLADAQNVELRALTDLQKALVTFERSQEAPGGSGGGGIGTGGGGN